MHVDCIIFILGHNRNTQVAVEIHTSQNDHCIFVPATKTHNLCIYNCAYGGPGYFYVISKYKRRQKHHLL